MPAVRLPDTDSIAANLIIRGLNAILQDRQDGISNHTSLDDTLSRMTGLRARDSGLSSYSSVNSAAILAAQQRRTIQIMCACMACFSILAAMCAIYWFTMMRRNYRRDLVLMLILGDFYKSVWYLTFGSVNFARGQVQSSDPFCQVSGFMLQTGLESCDMAILFISLHMMLQIFPPKNSIFGHDGLYKVRRWVFAAWILIPCLNAGLAFINPHGAYQAQGAWCWLPIRPIWYRLALSWAPRYLIWIFVMAVAIRIYSHVGYEFQVFGGERDRSSSMDMTAQSSVERAAIANVSRMHHANTESRPDEDDDDVAPDDVSVRRPVSKQSSPPESSKHLPFNGGRRHSLPAWRTPFAGTHTPPGCPVEDALPAFSSRSNPPSRRGSRQIAAGIFAEDFMAPPGFDTLNPRGSVSTVGSLARSMTSASVDHQLPPIAEARPSQSTRSSAPTNLVDRALQQRRRAIQRQLRILFIYPVVYMLLWLIPFVAHCLQYSDYFAQNPIFALSALSSFCQTFMGFADVCVFCWRERPWHHIPGSDGSFFGSFCYWRFGRETDCFRRESKAPEQMPSMSEKSPSQAGLLSSLKRWSLSRKSSTSPRASTSIRSAPRSSAPRPGLGHKRTFSGGSDRRTREAELAYERLALERGDFQRQRPSLNERRQSVISQIQRSPTKDWWDAELDAEKHHDLE